MTRNSGPETGHIARRQEQDLEGRILSSLLRWSFSNPRWVPLLLKIAWRVWRADRKRVANERRLGTLIPSAVAISPTMQCNYNCNSCYSRGRSSEGEMSTSEIDSLLTEAERLGVALIVVTGGEPLMRQDLLDLMDRHKRLFFIMITNGSLITPEAAGRIARNGNIFPLVSIEGSQDCTDQRRQFHAYETAIQAFGRFRDAGAIFGFSAMTTAANFESLITEAFADRMVTEGCSFGFFIEYVPCGPNPRQDWLLDEPMRAEGRRRVLDIRRRKPIVISQFPHDEYGVANRCTGAGQKTLHINSQGDVEPCPFVPVSRDNIRRGGLLAACRSPFMRAIRERPFMLQRHRYACSLFEHRSELEGLAQQFGPRLVQREKVTTFS